MLNQRPCSLLISLNHTERTTGAPRLAASKTRKPLRKRGSSRSRRRDQQHCLSPHPSQSETTQTTTVQAHRTDKFHYLFPTCSAADNRCCSCCTLWLYTLWLPFAITHATLATSAKLNQLLTLSSCLSITYQSTPGKLFNLFIAERANTKKKANAVTAALRDVAGVSVDVKSTGKGTVLCALYA